MGLMNKFKKMWGEGPQDKKETEQSKEKVVEDSEKAENDERKERLEEIQLLIEGTAKERQIQIDDIEKIVHKEKLSIVDLTVITTKAGRLGSLLRDKAQFMKDKYKEVHEVTAETEDEKRFAANILADRDLGKEGRVSQWNRNVLQKMETYEKKLGLGKIDNRKEYLSKNDLNEQTIEQLREDVAGFLAEYVLLEQEMLGNEHENPDETMIKAVTAPTITRPTVEAVPSGLTGNEPTIEHISVTDDTIVADELDNVGVVDLPPTQVAIDAVADTVEADTIEKTIPSTQSSKKDTIDTSSVTLDREAPTQDMPPVDKAA